MGRWTLEHISGHAMPLDNSTEYGHTVCVIFRLRYFPFGQFVETPPLEWNEEIFAIDHDEGSYWTFSTDQYDLKPMSPTFEFWVKRYIIAHQTANGIAYSGKMGRGGKAQLFNLQNVGVQGNKLSKAKNDEQRADAVRDYLEKNGGYLVIEIRDIPHLGKPKANDQSTHKERLLIFDSGVKGSPQRFKAMQHLKVRAGVDKSTWQRQFRLGPDMEQSRSTFRQTMQLQTKVAHPKIYSTKGSRAVWHGEYL